MSYYFQRVPGACTVVIIHFSSSVYLLPKKEKEGWEFEQIRTRYDYRFKIGKPYHLWHISMQVRVPLLFYVGLVDYSSPFVTPREADFAAAAAVFPSPINIKPNLHRMKIEQE